MVLRTPWVDEGHRSYRWVRRFAIIPRYTLDAGWTVGRFWVWECVWGWGFHDRHKYKSPLNVPAAPIDPVWVHGGY